MNQMEASDYNQALEKIKILTEAMKQIQELFVTNDSGRFGAIVSADAVVIAEEALRKVEEMK